MLTFRLLFAGLFFGPLLAAWATEVLEETIVRDYPIEPRARFTLQNEDGSVAIYGADIAEMRLQATKKAYSRERLGKIDVNVAVQRGSVAVRTTFPPRPKWGLFDRSGTVDYVIILPWRCNVQQVELANGEMLVEGMRGKEVHAHLGNGQLFGHNCFSDLHLSLGSGGMDIVYDWWEPHPFALDASIGNGTAHLFVPGEAQARIHAAAPNGNIFSDFPAREGGQTGFQGKTLDLIIGETPNADLKIEAGDGNIEINEESP